MQIHRVIDSTEAFVNRQVPGGLTEAEVWVFDPPAPCLVLGSAQDLAVADTDAAAAAGLEVVRRRSGGGAVFVDPRRSLWLDVIVPPADPRWSDDVRQSSHWLGQAWARALAEIGISGEMYDGGLEKTRWGRLVCFAANGPGEVLVQGRKTVGIAQRRTREGARFQCIVYDRWDPSDVLDHVVMDADDRAAARMELIDVASGVGDRLEDLRASILHELQINPPMH